MNISSHSVQVFFLMPDMQNFLANVLALSVSFDILSDWTVKIFT